MLHIRRRGSFRFDRSNIHVAILIMYFEPERSGFQLTSPARRSKIANLKDARKGGS